MPAVYDLKEVVVTIGGIAVGGYAENEAVRFEYVDDAATVTHSQDGRLLPSRSTINTIIATIALNDQSRSVTQLFADIEAQHGLSLPQGLRPRVLLPLVFQLTDPVLGDFVTSNQLIFLDRPGFGKVRNLGMSQFRMALDQPAVSRGLNNLL